MDRNKTILVLGFLLLAVTAWAFYYFLTHTGEETPSPPPPSFDTEARSPFISRFVSQIVFDPDKPGVLYVAVVEQGIFRSPDKGKNWVHLSADFQNLMIYQLMLNPRDSDHLYAGTYGSGVFQSLDGGSSWSATNTGLTNTSVEALSFHPHEADILYLATTGGGFFKSLDGGKTWFAYNEGLPDWDHNHTQTFLAFKKTGELLFGNYQGLFLRQEADPRSKNSSPPWTRVEIAPDDAAVTFFFKDPVSNRFYLSTRKGNFYS
ncbi:MAG TPA: hypothetical protein VIU33_01490, partial [Nitrospiria bacterium]